jgi:hypothetical protein
MIESGVPVGEKIEKNIKAFHQILILKPFWIFS